MSETPVQLRGPGGVSMAAKSIELMARNQVPPTAQNYEVWLTYVLGGPAELRNRIDQQIISGLPFTDELNEDLYEEFFSGQRASAQMAMAGEKIVREIDEVVSALEMAGERAASYGGELQSARAGLDQGLDPSALQQLVSKLALATRDMVDDNRRLSKRLGESSSEVELMRKALVKVRAEALTDGLTGLANRKMFDETLRMRMREAVTDKSELCLMMLDIDHFKRFNDTWGHQTGDQIIRFIASALQRNALPDYCAARYGGEEFALIMPRTGSGEAKMVAEGLRRAIESKKLLRKSTAEDLGRVTISSGVAKLRPGESPEDLIERADACLYASKRGGRNQVTTDADPPKRSLG